VITVKSNKYLQEGLGLNIVRRPAKVAFGIGVTLLIILSLAPGPELPNVQLSDKWGHFIAYAMVTLAFGIGWANWRQYVAGAFAIFALGVTLEGLQSFVPGRQPSFLDVAVNTIGVLVGICLAVVIVRAIEARAGSAVT
jgi:VanZ family protein